MAAEPLVSDEIATSLFDVDTFVEAISDAYFLLSSDGLIRRTNFLSATVLGSQELEGVDFGLFFRESLDWAGVNRGDQKTLHFLGDVSQSAQIKFVSQTASGDWHCLLTTDYQQQRFREQLLRQSSLIQMTLCSISDAVISVDAEGKVATVNPMARELLRLGDQRGVGLPVDQLLVIADPKNHQPLTSCVKDILDRQKANMPATEALLYVEEHKPILINVQAVALRNSSNHTEGCLIVFRDTSQAGRENHRLNWQAKHDALTALPNRQAFELEISQAVEAAQQKQTTFGLLYIDIYQFKVINDSCGHVGGDELLRQLSDLMSNKLRNQDLLARLGSDEFGVLLRNCTLAGAQRIADILLSEVQQFQFQWDRRDIKVGVSIGVLVIDQDAESEGQVLATANAACCAAKELGRNRIHLYNKDREVEQRRNEINWVVKINDALSKNRLCLYEQEIAALNPELCGGLAHSEILIRLKGESGELVSPVEFIPAAERFGLMDDIDRWVIEQVVEHLRQRRLRHLPDKIYSVNLSGFTLGDPSLAEYVLNVIDEAGIDASLLHFEVTETAAIRHLDSAVEFMRLLKDRGSCFYLDDFGSGLSSFSYLKELPVDYLKIDGSFVKTMLTESVSLAMVSTINHLAHSMSLKTVAEYVETDALKQKLADIGVDFVQGFGISRPHPLILD
ncbi:MAG: EAL domain-containing protein [Cellvibrionaceae bacterium]